MKSIRKHFSAMAAALLLAVSAQSLEAANYCTDAGGCGYEECRTTPCLSPAIALGAVAIAAIVAVALQNSHGKNGHSHA